MITKIIRFCQTTWDVLILSPDEILGTFKAFYYETALSASDVNLKAVDNFVQKDHILVGTDFPGEFSSSKYRWNNHRRLFVAVSIKVVERFTRKVGVSNMQK